MGFGIAFWLFLCVRWMNEGMNVMKKGRGFVKYHCYYATYIVSIYPAKEFSFLSIKVSLSTSLIF